MRGDLVQPLVEPASGDGPMNLHSAKNMSVYSASSFTLLGIRDTKKCHSLPKTRHLKVLKFSTSRHERAEYTQGHLPSAVVRQLQ